MQPPEKTRLLARTRGHTHTGKYAQLRLPAGEMRSRDSYRPTLTAQASCTPSHNSLGLPLEERLPPPPLLGAERLVAVRLRVDGAALSPPHPEAVFEDELLWNAAGPVDAESRCGHLDGI